MTIYLENTWQPHPIIHPIVRTRFQLTQDLVGFALWGFESPLFAPITYVKIPWQPKASGSPWGHP